MEKLVPISEEEESAANDHKNDESGQLPNLHSKKVVIYSECLRNHAAAMGVNATDGCGEFMPGGSLICSACNCHRNFHRKLEFEADDYFNQTNLNPPTGVLLNNVVPRNSCPGGSGGKKRLRSKFSSEQKEKMLEFAESVGWKMQKQEEASVQKVCQDIGVKPRVLKVWMHNNKKKSIAHAAQKSDQLIN